MLYKKLYDESDWCQNACHFYRSSPTTSHEVPCQKMRIEEMVFPVEGRQLRTKGMNCIYNGYCHGPHGPPHFLPIVWTVWPDPGWVHAMDRSVTTLPITNRMCNMCTQTLFKR